jgi:Flp pilus assembly protein TadB
MKVVIGGVFVVAGLTAIVWVGARMEREAKKQEQAFDDAIGTYVRDVKAEQAFADHARRHPGRWLLLTRN